MKLKRILKRAVSSVIRAYIRLIKALPLRNRVFFYSIRSDGALEGNAKIIYDMLECPKCFFAKRLPHSRFDLPLIYYRLLSSKVIVTDDYLKYCRMTELRDGQKLIQLWHACGAFKKFGLDAPSRLTAEEERKTHRFYTDVCVSSENVREFYASAFGLDIERISAIGVPRTDELLDKTRRGEMKKEAESLCPNLRGKTVYLYCPTFREKDGVISGFDCGIDFDALDSELSGSDLFVIKQHPLIKQPMLKKEYEHIIEASAPTSLLITAAGAVITDYSSVIYDALLCGKPLLFYCPDYKSYERDFYLNFPDDLPGEMIINPAELLDSIRNTAGNPLSEKAAEFMKNQLFACDGHSAERIAELVMKRLNEK